jgi:transposase
MPKYTDEFKHEAVRRVNDGEKAAAVARDMGVSAATVRGWATDPRIGKSHGAAASKLAQEVAAMRAQIEQLNQELDFALKAAAYFAKYALRAMESEARGRSPR